MEALLDEKGQESSKEGLAEEILGKEGLVSSCKRGVAPLTKTKRLGRSWCAQHPLTKGAQPTST
jgi:hypothetical protein